MPYSADHKAKTRARIVEAARILFNRHGFQGVTIDEVMAQAGLTRGGFYNHFATKDDLYAEAVDAFLMGRGAQWRADAGIDMASLCPEMALQMVDSYLSDAHLNDLDGQCPMIALPSDVARSGSDVQAAYARLLSAMVWLFERSLQGDPEARQKALSMAAALIGGMILSRTLPDEPLAKDVRAAARASAAAIVGA